MMFVLWFFFFKQKTAYEMRINDWSSDVCSSDLEYLAPQGYFAGHGEFFLYLTLRKARGQGGEHGDTGRRTIFRGRTGWNVDVYVPRVKDAVIDTKGYGVCPEIGHGNRCRFFHHIAQVDR